MTEASGLPATTMSNGVIEGLKAVGARKVAVATAYNDEVNARLRVFLIEHGMTPVVVTGLGIEAMKDIDRVTRDDLIAFGERVRKSAADADSLLVSCGGFRTLEIIAPLEARTGVPVISSMPHGLWAGARLVGLSGVGAGLWQAAVAQGVDRCRPGVAAGAIWFMCAALAAAGAGTSRRTELVHRHDRRTPRSGNPRRLSSRRRALRPRARRLLMPSQLFDGAQSRSVGQHT